MTEEQKAKFCDEYCRYLKWFKTALAYSKGVHGYGKEFAKTFAKCKKILNSKCEKCPFVRMSK